MKKQILKLISTTVFSIAKKSTNVACNWRSFQPKVPEKLVKK